MMPAIKQLLSRVAVQGRFGISHSAGFFLGLNG
jgi:hypothetical protein